MLAEFLKNPPPAIVKYPAGILRQRTEQIATVTDEVVAVARKMFEFMYKFRGVGLAAPQVGLPVRMFVVNPLCDPERKDKEHVFINPNVFHFGTRPTESMEGCLSLPGISLAISRPHKVMFKALDLEGKEQKYCFEGTMGRIIQHEYDHLEGVLIIDKVSDMEKERIGPLIAKLEGR